MLSDWVFIALGLGLLVLGGEALVRGASGVALLGRMSPSVVGLTIVAAGTSMPELVVSVGAALDGSPDLAFGNVVGSNIFNIGAILGITAVVRPLQIEGNTVRLEWPVMLLSALQLHLLSRDGQVDRLEGAFLLVGLLAFVGYAVFLGRQVVKPLAQETSLSTASLGRTGAAGVLLNGLAIVAGAGLLTVGASLLVRGASDVARAMGVSQALVGLTVVSAGTSLPELITSLVAAHRGQTDIAVANVVGSNIFNILGILAATALIQPLQASTEIVHWDNWWMIGASLLLFPLMKTGMRITRAEGSVLLLGYGVYLGGVLRVAGAF